MGKLVLSRQCGQAVRIGEHIVVRVVKIDQDRVRLAFEAPADVEIWREELPVSVRYHSSRNITPEGRSA
jgi:carbon storage regulator CsrA